MTSLSTGARTTAPPRLLRLLYELADDAELPEEIASSQVVHSSSWSQASRISVWVPNTELSH